MRTKVSSITLLAGILLILLAAMHGQAMGEEPVYFADANLKAAVEEALGISDPIPTDMLVLTTLWASGKGITDLTGLEYAKNLTRLDLKWNQISNISALSGLTNLTELDLWHNQISDISALSGLKNVTNLYLHHNQISGISALSGLTNLTSLYLSGNQISDISALSGLTNLMGLSLSGNQISDISALAGLTNLKFLHLPYNQISDISALSGLTNVTNLDLHLNQISDISAVSGLTNLTSLGLYSNQISDISALSGLTNLTGLYLHYNQISDISALSGLTNLHELWLQNNPLNADAYDIYIPQILENNPGIYFLYDPRAQFMITFDDGPIPGQTDSILLQLKNCKVDGEPVKAAFFMNGDPNPLYYAPYDFEWDKGSVLEDSAAVNRVQAHGHFIGNHTQHHSWFIQGLLFGFSSMKDFVKDEIFKCDSEIKKALGKSPPRIFRAPYLQHRDYPDPIYEAAGELGFTVVKGEVADISPLVPHSLSDVQEKARDIIESWEEDEPRVLIFHDNRSDTYNHIGEIISYLQNEGYTLAHFDISRIPKQTQQSGEGIKEVLSGIARCPVDLLVNDPEGLILSKEQNQIPDALYKEVDVDSNGELADFFVIPEPKEGIYLIEVIPEADASPNDTFTLAVNRDGTTIVLSQDVQVQDIPDFPFVVTTLTSLSADMEIEPETLSLSSEGNWITSYIQFPEAYYVANIDSSTILLNGEIPPARLFAGDEEDIEQILMVKFDRSDLQKIIQPGNVELIVTGELLDGTPFECRDTIRVIE